MDSFILYLRSFKDDKKKVLDEFRILYLLQNYSKVFEVGRPNEFYSSNNGAQHLYIGENWKENVLTMMDKAVFILMRINTTDNYLWKFEQCHSKKLLDKVIFWITDLQEYKRFCAITYEKCTRIIRLFFCRINVKIWNSFVYLSRTTTIEN